jgi:hypothetical protein
VRTCVRVCVCVCVCACVCVCDVMWQVVSAGLESSPHFTVRLRPTNTGQGRQDKKIYFCLPSLQIGLGGLRRRPSCRGGGPLPSSRPRPKQCRLPLPLAFIRRVTWQPALETSSSSSSPLPSQPARNSNRPFARQLDGWGGGEVWARAWAWGH